MTLYRVTADTLNLRKEPSKESEVIDSFNEGTLVWGTHKSEDEKWMAIDFGGNKEGWLSKKYIAPVEEECPPWLEVAVKELGVKEYEGSADNPRIVEYLKTTTLGEPDNKNDEPFWCSTFVNWCMKQAHLNGTNRAMARSWLHWGEKLANPRFGCVVVFKRPPSTTAGHVGFYIGETPTGIQVFGGNQGDEVKISPYSKQRVLGYRWKS